MEPLCAGLPVCVGPHHLNNREALQFQQVILKPGMFAVNVIQNAQDLQSLMTCSMSLSVPSAPLLSRIRMVSGATQRVIHWLEDTKVVS